MEILNTQFIQPLTVLDRQLAEHILELGITGLGETLDIPDNQLMDLVEQGSEEAAAAVVKTQHRVDLSLVQLAKARLS